MAKSRPTAPPPSAPPAGGETFVFDVVQADVALAELGKLEALAKSVKAELDGAINAAKKDAAAKLICTVRGQRVAVTDRREALEAALKAYVTAHREELFAKGLKSREMTYGVVGFRQSPAKLAPVDGQTEDEILKTLRDQVIVKLNAALDTIKLGGVPASTVLTVDVALDKAGLFAAHNKSRVTIEQLKSLGLRVVAAEDQFFAKPTTVALKEAS